MNDNSKTAGAGLLAALVASLCCITPLLAFIGGISGVAATFSWVEPFRLYLIALTVMIIGFAWYRQWQSSKAEENCGCEDETGNTKFIHTKRFLGMITVVAALLLTFPGYAHIFYPNQESVIATKDQETKELLVNVSGMTCSGCENHIEQAVAKLEGVRMAEASYANGVVMVSYESGKVTENDIESAINSTGYKVIPMADMANKIPTKPTRNCCATGSCKALNGANATISRTAMPLAKPFPLVPVTEANNAFKDHFNNTNGKKRFVAILSPTCGWCLSGAESVKETIIKKAQGKEVDVSIVWINMVDADNEVEASFAANIFRDYPVQQFFDTEKLIAKNIAQSLWGNDEVAWDIYMLFNDSDTWDDAFPTPLDHYHQLNPTTHTWVDAKKYQCGPKLTLALNKLL